MKWLFTFERLLDLTPDENRRVLAALGPVLKAYQEDELIDLPPKITE
jgi:hypothetical protein